MNEVKYFPSTIDNSQFGDIYYDDISEMFKNSINLNNRIKSEVETAYKRYLLNEGKLILNFFHLKYIEMLEELIKKSNDNQDFNKLSEYITSLFSDYFNKFNDNLSINDKNDLDRLKYILEISFIIMNNVLEDYDEELAYEAFFQIKHKLKQSNLYHESLTITGENKNYNYKIVIQPKTNETNYFKSYLLEKM